MTTREKRKKRQRASASRRAEKRAAGDRSSLKLPEGLKFFKKKEGTKKLNIIEFKAGKGNPNADEGVYHYERTFYVHYIPIGGQTVPRVCNRKTFGTKCAACDHITILQKDEDVDDKLVSSLIPKERQIMLVNDLKDEEYPLQLYEDAYKNFGDRLDTEVLAEKEDNPDIELFAAAGDEGKTLRVSFTEESFMGRKYIKADAIKFLPRNEDADEELWEHEHCLDDFIVKSDYASLKKELLGEDDNEDDDETEKKKKSKTKSKEKDEDDEDEDDEDEEPPKSSKKKKPSERDLEDEDDESEEDEEVDDDEESEEADEEDDEVKPPKKGKGSASSKSKSKDEDDDDDADEEEDEDEDGPPLKFKKGDKVSFVYKGKKRTGKIVKVDVENEIVRIKCEDREQPYNVGLDDEDAKIKVLKKPEAEDDNEGEDDGKSSKKSSQKASSKSTSSSKKSSKKKEEDEDEDDDIPFDDDEDDEDEDDDDE